MLVAGAALGLGWGWLRQHKRHLVDRLARAEAEVRERTRNQETLRQAKEEAERAHAEAEVAEQKAERASNAKSEFLSRVSHELRTPLNAILGFGQLLELEELTSTQSQGVGQILGGGRHLLGLVDEVLDLARIERGEMDLRLEDVELGSLLAETVGWITPLARERGVRLHLEHPGAAVTVVRADRQRLRQVLFNLLSNAVKYNRAGGEVVVTVQGVSPADERRRSSCRAYRLLIRDTGRGIAPEDQERLFTPFERLGAAYGPVEGTGLGLTVSKQLIEVMGGVIGVESSVGVGYTFGVELPGVLATGAGGIGEESSALETDGAETADPAGIPACAPTLLYVEDNAANRDLVAHLLAAFRPDLRLLLAQDAEEGLAVARREVPGLGFILLDLNLPGMSGEAALAELRADPRTAAVPVAILSGDATARTRERLLAAGARAYLTKPFNVQRFLALMDDFMPSPQREIETGAQVEAVGARCDGLTALPRPLEAGVRGAAEP